MRIELLKNTCKSHYLCTEIWVYKVNDKGELSLMANQPYKTKREASRALGIHNSVFSKYLYSSELYKGLLISSTPQHFTTKYDKYI